MKTPGSCQPGFLLTSQWPVLAEKKWDTGTLASQACDMFLPRPRTLLGWKEQSEGSSLSEVKAAS